MENIVTSEQIARLLDASDVTEHVFFDKVLVVVYRLPCGFCLVGQGSCVDPKNFDILVGRYVAREDIENQLWKLEGYNLQLAINNIGSKAA